MRADAARTGARCGDRIFANHHAVRAHAADLVGGVLIKDVQQGPGALIGLRPGDVITHLNNQPVLSAKQFAEVAKALPAKRSVSMRVLRQGRASFITFKLAE